MASGIQQQQIQPLRFVAFEIVIEGHQTQPAGDGEGGEVAIIHRDGSQTWRMWIP